MYYPNTADSAKDLTDNSDVILFALPVNGHKGTIDAISPHIKAHHHVIISSY